MHVLRSPSIALVLATGLCPLHTQAQTCNTGDFYAVSYQHDTYALTLSGNTVTIGDPVIGPGTSLQGLAIADVGEGSSFYSSIYPGIVAQAVGTTWQTVYTDTHVRPNAGGHGPYLYFQNMRTVNPNPLFTNRIERFDGTAMTTIWADSTVFQTVADLAVDDDGNVYFFTGESASQSTQLNVISSTGTLLATMPVSFNGIDAYGAMLMGNTLYVAFGLSSVPFPGKLLPFTLAGGTATMGTPITIPSTSIGGGSQGPVFLQFSDIATCASAHVELSTGIAPAEATVQHIVYDPQLDGVRIRMNGTGRSASVVVRDVTGRAVATRQGSGPEFTIGMEAYPAGIYLVEVLADGRGSTQPIMKL